MEAISRPKFRSLTPAEAKALRTLPPEPGEKEAFLRATIGIMTEEEAREMERVINAASERIDD